MFSYLFPTNSHNEYKYVYFWNTLCQKHTLLCLSQSMRINSVRFPSITHEELQSSFLPSEENLSLVLRDSYYCYTVLIQIEMLFQCHIAIARYQLQGFKWWLPFYFVFCCKWTILVLLHIGARSFVNTMNLTVVLLFQKRTEWHAQIKLG